MKHCTAHFSKFALDGRLLSAIFLLLYMFGAVAQSDDSASFYEDALVKFHDDDLRGAVIQLKNALSEEPRYAPARVLLGQIYVKLELGAEAEKELENARQGGADPALFEFDLARAYLLQEKYKDVLSALPTGGKDLVRESHLLVLRGQAYLGLGKLDEAHEAFRTAESWQPLDPAPLIGQGQVMIARGEMDKAQQLATQATEYAPDNAPAWGFKGNLHRLTGKLEDAVAAYDKAIELDPGAVGARLTRAALLIDLKRDEEALEDIAIVRKSAADQPHAAYLKALVLIRRGELEAAKAELKTAADMLRKIDPRAMQKHPGLLLLSGLVHFSEDSFESARAALRQYLDVDPQHVSARKVLGVTLLRLDKPSEAIEIMTPALATAPDDVALLAIMAEAQLAAGNAEKASTHLLTAATLAPERTDLQMRLIQAKLVTGRPQSAIYALESLIAKQPDAIEARVQLVALHMQLNDFDAALAAAQALVEVRPAAAFAHNLLGSVHLERQEAQAANSAFKLARALDPELHLVRLNLARVDLLRADIDGAEQRLKALIDDGALVIPAQIGLAAIELQRGNTKRASAWLDKAQRNRELTDEQRLQLVTLYIQAGDPREAKSLAEDFVDNAPDNPLALGALGEAQIAAGETDAARKTLREMAEAAETMKAARALYRAGQLQLSIDDVDGARSSLTAAVRLEPGLSEAQATLAVVLAQSGEFESALAIADSLRAKSPESAIGDTTRGDVFMLTKHYDAAAGAYDFALQKKPSSVLALRRFHALRSAQDSDGAVSFLAEWLEQYPADHAARRVLAAEQIATGDFKLAAHNYQVLNALYPDDAELLNNLAWLRHQLGDQSAVKLAERAHQLNPKDVGILDTLGWLMVQRGDASGGLKHLRDALVRAPQNPQVQYHLAATLNKLGRGKEARRELKSALDSGQEFYGIADARALMAELSAQQ